MMRRLVVMAVVAFVLGISPRTSAAGTCDAPASVAAARAAVEAACPCTGSARGEWIRCAAGVLRAQLASGGLARGCKVAAKRCLTASTCGRPDRVTCCGATRDGHGRCQITTAARCLQVGGCVGQFTNCCDACGGTTCASTTTTTTTSPSTTETTTTTTLNELRRVACCATTVDDNTCVQEVPHYILFVYRNSSCPGGTFIDGRVPSGTTQCPGGAGVIGTCVPLPPLAEPVTMCLYSWNPTACSELTTDNHEGWTHAVWSWAYARYPSWFYVRGTCGDDGVCIPAP